MAYSVEIINTNSKKFRFQEAECKRVDYSMNTKFLKQTLPNAKAEQTIIINLGREKTVVIPFSLRETSVDASDSTHSSTVKTVQEKIDYLIGTFITNGIEDKYTVNIYSSTGNITNIKGIVENFSLNFVAEKPLVLAGNISITVGGDSQ